MACKRSAVRSRLAPPAFASHELRLGKPLGALRRREWRRLPRRSCLATQAGSGRTYKYVYILQSLSDPDRFYTGVTGDVERRLAKHNAKEVPHTSKYGPWTLKTYIAFSDEAQAFAFEKYLKSGSGSAIAESEAPSIERAKPNAASTALGMLSFGLILHVPRGALPNDLVIRL